MPSICRLSNLDKLHLLRRSLSPSTSKLASERCRAREQQQFQRGTGEIPEHGYTKGGPSFLSTFYLPLYKQEGPGAQPGVRGEDGQ